ncbi:MAG: hypothetical protein ACKVOU_10150, partial [Cytophagales bacterium]
YCCKNKIQLTIYLHAERIELEDKSFNSQGQEIIQFARSNKINLILDLENNLEVNDFRDNIHLNSQGQKKLAKAVFKQMTESVQLQ